MAYVLLDLSRAAFAADVVSALTDRRMRIAAHLRFSSGHSCAMRTSHCVWLLPLLLVACDGNNPVPFHRKHPRPQPELTGFVRTPDGAGIAGATVQVLDGPNEGRSARTTPEPGIIFSLERANSDPWSGSLENCSWVTCHQNTANGCATEKDELAALKHAKVTVGPRLCRGARGPSNREVTLGILFAPVQMEMRVRLTRKLADEIDGIDLKGQTVGDVFELPEREARVLLAEEWAIPDSRAAERPRQVPYPQSRAS